MDGENCYLHADYCVDKEEQRHQQADIRKSLKNERETQLFPTHSSHQSLHFVYLEGLNKSPKKNTNGVTLSEEFY